MRKLAPLFAVLGLFSVLAGCSKSEDASAPAPTAPIDNASPAAASAGGAPPPETGAPPPGKPGR